MGQEQIMVNLTSLNSTIDTHRGDIGTVQKRNLNRFTIHYWLPITIQKNIFYATHSTKMTFE